MSLFGNSQYTLGSLLNIDQGRQDRASQCNVKLEGVYHELKKETILDKIRKFFGGKSSLNIYYVIFKFSVISDTGNSHTVYIRTNPDFNLSSWSSNKVKIYCDCQDFKYRSAYILNQHSSLFSTNKTKIALGAAVNDAPKGKTKTTLLCKHAFAALSWLSKNYVSIMRTI